MTNTESFYFFLSNIVMMGWNITLSIVPISLARVLKRTPSPLFQIPIFLLWLVFLPNTLYMLTDVIHLFNPKFGLQTNIFQIAGIYLYSMVITLAVLTFVLSLSPVFSKYRVFLRRLSPNSTLLLFLLFSLLVGFAIAMGRFQRTNTWYIFTQPTRVVHDIFAALTDPTVIVIALCYSIGAFVIILLTDRHTN